MGDGLHCIGSHHHEILNTPVKILQELARSFAKIVTYPVIYDPDLSAGFRTAHDNKVDVFKMTSPYLV